MTQEQVNNLVDEYLRKRWPSRLANQGAAPICVIGMKMLDDADCGRPVLIGVENHSIDDLAALLLGMAKMLMAESGIEPAEEGQADGA